MLKFLDSKVILNKGLDLVYETECHFNQNTKKHAKTKAAKSNLLLASLELHFSSHSNLFVAVVTQHTLATNQK